MTFYYSRRLQFYETDAMGIIYHGNYLNLMEEARVDWLRQNNILSLGDINFPVIEAQVRYAHSMYFDDEARIAVRPRIEKIRLFFEYEISTKRFSDPVAFGKTVHVAMDMKTRKPTRLPKAVHDLLSK